MNEKIGPNLFLNNRGNKFSYINCNDYEIGDFKPISFKNKLKWTIIRSKFHFVAGKKLPKDIFFKSGLIKVISYPYSYGEFIADGYEIGFGGKYNFLGTNDPEEALYLTEQKVLKWAEKKTKYYKRWVDILKPTT